MIVTRFAPSPNGPLHLGHAYSAIRAHDLAMGGAGRTGKTGRADAQTVGRFLLRIEDIDGARSRPELADAFRRDLRWLGLDWEDVAAQSARHASYRAAAQKLKAMDLLYPCICTRTQIAQAATKSGPEGPIYPGTCRRNPPGSAIPAAWRIDVAKAMRRTGPLLWYDELAGEQDATPQLLGDQVLWRKDDPASYHLAATLDDAADGITLVTRGRDLFPATHLHRLLQALLGLPVPRWHHHALVLDDDGRKLSKSRHSPSLADMRRSGVDGHELAAQLRSGHLPSTNTLSIL